MWRCAKSYRPPAPTPAIERRRGWGVRTLIGSPVVLSAFYRVADPRFGGFLLGLAEDLEERERKGLVFFSLPVGCFIWRFWEVGANGHSNEMAYSFGFKLAINELVW